MADEREWTSEQRIYQLWLAMPRRFREPKTKQGLAAELGITRQAMMRWEKMDGFLVKVEDERLKRMKNHLSDIYEAMAEKAIAGDVNAAKFCRDVAMGESNTRKVIVDNKAAGAADKQSPEEVMADLHRLLQKGAHGDKIPPLQSLVKAMQQGPAGNQPRLPAGLESPQGEA